MKKVVYVICLVFVLGAVGKGSAFAENGFITYCANYVQEHQECPPALCQMKCRSGIQFENCELVCQPKDCIDIDAEHCPLEHCRLLDGCNQKKVCYHKNIEEPSECGDLSYSGDLECCEGLVKRCGIEFFDRTCDMKGENSVYGVPICIPCGDGKCTQFENACNCPEDCK